MAQDPERVIPDGAMGKFKVAMEENNYKGQACFFLNAFWNELGEEEAPLFWRYVQKMNELDTVDFEEGHALDFAKSLSAKLFLEHFGEAMSHLQLKETLNKIDADHDKKMSLLEYAVWKYSEKFPQVTIQEMMKRPQGVNKALKEAQKKLKIVEEEIEKIENKKNELEKLSLKPGVAGMRAKNELNQLLSMDQTDLNRAIITAQAAVRLAQKSSGDLAAQGTIWFMNKELKVANSYKPKKNLKR